MSKSNKPYTTDDFLATIKRQENLYRSIADINISEKVLGYLEPIVELSKKLPDKVGENYYLHILCVPTDETLNDIEIKVQATFKDSVIYKSFPIYYNNSTQSCTMSKKKESSVMSDVDLSEFFDDVLKNAQQNIIDCRAEILERIYSYDVIHNKITEANTNKMLEDAEQKSVSKKSKNRI